MPVPWTEQSTSHPNLSWMDQKWPPSEAEPTTSSLLETGVSGAPAPGWWQASELRDTAIPSQVRHSYGRAEASRRGKPSRQGKAGERTCQEADPPRSCLGGLPVLGCELEHLWHPFNKTSACRFSIPCNQSEPKQTRASKSEQRIKIQIKRVGKCLCIEDDNEAQVPALSSFSYQTGRGKKALQWCTAWSARNTGTYRLETGVNWWDF